MDKNSLYALLLATIAGLSTGLGSLLIFFVKKANQKILSYALGFSAGVMVMVSLADMLPHAASVFTTEKGNVKGGIITIIILLIGMIFAFFIDKLVPEDDHNKGVKGANSINNKSQKSVLKVGLVSAIAILLHNLPEGIATFMAGYKDITLGISITVAIALHNIPEGIAVSIPIYYGTGSKSKAFFYSLVTGLSEPVGALIAFLILKPFMSDLLLGGIFAFIAGIMVYIAFDELIPASREYGYSHISLYGILSGLCIMGIGLFVV